MSEPESPKTPKSVFEILLEATEDNNPEGQREILTALRARVLSRIEGMGIDQRQKIAAIYDAAELHDDANAIYLAWPSKREMRIKDEKEEGERRKIKLKEAKDYWREFCEGEERNADRLLTLLRYSILPQEVGIDTEEQFNQLIKSSLRNTFEELLNKAKKGQYSFDSESVPPPKNYYEWRTGSQDQKIGNPRQFTYEELNIDPEKIQELERLRLNWERGWRLSNIKGILDRVDTSEKREKLYQEDKLKKDIELLTATIDQAGFTLEELGLNELSWEEIKESADVIKGGQMVRRMEGHLMDNDYFDIQQIDELDQIIEKLGGSNKLGISENKLNFLKAQLAYESARWIIVKIKNGESEKWERNELQKLIEKKLVKPEALGLGALDFM